VTTSHAEALALEVGGARTSGIAVRPESARAGLLLAHGAGAGMRHAFLEALAQALAREAVATLRYQFPYAEKGGRRPDPPAVLEATVRAAVEAAPSVLPGLPLLAGGKSMGGRMTTQAASRAALPEIRGLVLVGFPLHAAGRPEQAPARSAHLLRVALPMLFLQGTRDALADPALVRPLAARLAPRARLHEIPDADHGFHVPRRSGRTDADVIDELAREIARFASDVGGAG
jgi:hypothetical protein